MSRECQFWLQMHYCQITNLCSGVAYGPDVGGLSTITFKMLYEHHVQEEA